MKEQTANIFYNRLFELNPELKKLFQKDRFYQVKIFMDMFSWLVMGLQRIHDITPVAQDLARRHTIYGVKEEDYKTLKEAFLYTLEKAFGSDFTPELKAAWNDAYDLIAKIMKDAARQVHQDTKKTSTG
jgi:hemoglobin-like flavoprotein